MPAVFPLVRYRFARFELQPDQRRLLDSGTPVHLRPHALDLLIVFVENAGQLVTKDELLRRVWDKVVVEENTLQAHISALRKVLGSQAIATVAGHGYRFTQQVIPIGAVDSSASTPKHNLPHALTSFIGREKEITDLEQLLDGARLLTLTGSGGCGKTRLAIQLAKQRAHAYPDGVWLVELAALTDAALAPQTVASVLSIKEKAGAKLLDTVAEFLAPRSVLLVLDNAEHLIDACAQLAESLLQRCARLVILVTSRERLGITGELIYRVPSLSVPDEETDTTPASIAAYESARLLIERARLQRPDFAINTQNSAAIASICRRLDGIALALELAAPRVRTISVEELSRRLDRRFELLTEGSRTALPRHRTLRSLIDWSYDLLTDSEKAMLRRVSVFAGGWTLEAAEQACHGVEVDGANTLALLTSLADKNLILVETHDGATRYAIFETVRHYAGERLRDSGEEALVRARHLEYFLSVAEKLANAKGDSERQVRLNRMDKEHDNLRAALAWCESAVTPAVSGLRLAGYLLWFWRTRGHFAEGRGWIARLLAVAPISDQEVTHATALNTAGILAYYQSAFNEAELNYRDSLEIWKRLGHRRGIVSALGNLGNLAQNRGDHLAARQLMEEALAVAREDGVRRHIATLLQNLGSLVFDMGDLTAAEALLEEAVPISREVGRWSAAEVLGDLGRVKHAQGDHLAARRWLLDALEGQREFGNKLGIAKTLVWLGILSHDGGDIATAKTQLKEALLIQQEVIGDRVSMALALEAFASLSLEFASPTDAARIWGRVQRLREEIVAPQSVTERERCQRHVATARNALQDDAAFDLAWDEGRSMILEEAVQWAMQA